MIKPLSLRFLPANGIKKPSEQSCQSNKKASEAMKLLSTFVAVSNAWSLGSCTTNGTAVDSDVTCRNSCDFDWIGRGPKVAYNELGKHENGFLASLNPQKWRFDYLNKDRAYVGVLRFDRTFCKRPILKGKIMLIKFVFIISNIFKQSALDESTLKFSTEPRKTT